MKILRCYSLIAMISLGGYDVGTARDAKKSPLPGPAVWNVEPLSSLFRVNKTEADEKGRSVRWVLETKETVRTADFVRSLDKENRLTFQFFDAADQEVATVQMASSDFKGFSRDKLTRAGTKIELTLELPSTFPKATKVVLRRGKVD